MLSPADSPGLRDWLGRPGRIWPDRVRARLASARKSLSASWGRARSHPRAESSLRAGQDRLQFFTHAFGAPDHHPD
jgi:hypothetical protein